MAFGAEAVIPTEIKIPTYRTQTFRAEENDDRIHQNLDAIEEILEQAHVRLAI